MNTELSGRRNCLKAPKAWPEMSAFVCGKSNVKHIPLIDPKYVILSSLHIKHDSKIIEFIPTWKSIIETAGSAKIGETKVNLEHTDCEYKECNIGNFYTDAMLDKLLSLSPYNNDNWTNISIALATAGELYLTLPQGVVTYGQIYSLFPFEAPLVAFDLEGIHLKTALEKSVSRINFSNNLNSTNTFLQVSGLNVVYNLNNPVNQRVLKVKVRCADCKVPIYEDLNINKVYRILTARYVAGGGYGFSIFKQYGQNRREYFTDMSSILEYVNKTSPIYTGLEGRIHILNSV